MNYLTIIFLLVGVAWTSPLPHFPLVVLKDLGSRIFNGEDAVVGQIPWQVGLFLSTPGLSIFCGGSILNEEWILTAAHCLLPDTELAEVVAGSVELNGTDAVLTSATTFVVHKDFSTFNLTNDIGLIKLDKPLKFTDNIRPINISYEYVEKDVNITVSGWGKTSNDATSISVNLHYVNLFTITNDDCRDPFGDFITEGILCAVPPPDHYQSPCSGDSGGPVVVNATDNPTLVGLVSFIGPDGCENDVPSGYTRLSYHREWIKNHTGI